MLISALTYCRQLVKKILDQFKRIHQAVSDPWPQNNIKSLTKELEVLLAEFPDNFKAQVLRANLMRNRGEIEKAITLRNDLLSIYKDSPATDKKITLLHELGRDYLSGGFLGRAKEVLEQARKEKKFSRSILEALAETYASLGNFEQCVKLYGQLGQKIPQGHFLVQLAREAKDRGEAKKYIQTLNRALATAPELTEGYIEKCLQALEEDDLHALSLWFKRGLKKVEPRLYLLFFEYLLPKLHPLACQTILPIVEEMPFEITISFYRSFLHVLLGEKDTAKKCLRNCLDHDPEFWPARLELISLDCHNILLPDDFRHELEILLDKGRTLKKFFCTHCGLRREQVFLQCPRCKQWQTISLLKPTWPL